MFSPLRNRFGIPGVISVIALVFAMLGGAYAANSNGGAGKAGASAKGKPGPRGKTGKTGPAGPVGPQGPAGSNGKDGANGSNGKDGAAGAPGKNGESVTVSSASAGECPEGGTKFSNGTGTGKACNGAEGEPGEPGEDGSPWTVGGVGGTLPPGAIEAGTWSANGKGEVFVPISFPIRLAEVVRLEGFGTENHFFYGYGLEGETGEFSEHCEVGAGDANPTPLHAGDLCIYADLFNSPEVKLEGIFKNHITAGGTTAGTLLKLFIPGTEAQDVMGTFAVRGCSTSLPVGDPDKCP